MNLKLEDITFVIVSYKSESTLYDCIDSLPKQSKKVIVENSSNINLKKDLMIKYDNIEVIMSKNIGMGAGNNIGLRSCSTQYAYVLNPDTKLKKDTLKNLLKELNNLSDFTLASPLNDNISIPNYKIIDSNVENKNILSVDSIDGFSMLLNMSKFETKDFFDENFFLYLENDDLCLRVKKKMQNIYIIKNALINHKGGISKNQELEYLRNWHWMWSKFYFNKKHNSFVYALIKITPNFFSSLVKFIYYSILFNNFKKNVYKMRFFGTLNSILGKSSFMRLESENVKKN